MKKIKKRSDPRAGKPISRRKIMKLASLAALYHLGSPLVSQSQLVKSKKKKKLKFKSSRSRAAHRSQPLPQIVKQPLFGTLNTTQPASQAEIKITRLLADQISHAFTIAAANPNEQFPKNSMAGEFSREFLKLNPEKRMAARKRAHSLLNLPISERRLYFGNYANKKSSFHKVVQPDLDANLQSLVKEAVRIRVEQYKSEIINYVKKEAKIRSGNSTKIGAYSKRSIKPTIQSTRKFSSKSRSQISLTRIYDIGTFIKAPSPVSVLESTGYDLTIHMASQTLDFKWKTLESRAERAVWAVFDSNTGRTVASGLAGNGKQGVFRIYFRKFLSSKPPDTPKRYYLQVFPYPAAPGGRRLSKYDSTPQFLPSMTAKEFKARAVGNPSSPVQISYLKSDPQDQTFRFYDVYRKLDLHLDYIEMISESCEWGTEEFHITGFVQEESGYFAGNPLRGEEPKGEQTLYQLRHHVETINPDGNRKKWLGGWERQYHLQNPDSEFYPKVFTVVFSVMEEDSGESVARWISYLWSKAQGRIRKQIHSYVYTAVKELFGYITDIILKEFIENFKMVAKIVDAIASALSTMIVGMIIDVIAEIVKRIIEGTVDDYYGTASIILVLPTNMVEYIKNLPGRAVSGGRYILKQQKSKQMLGPPCPGDAVNWDGSVQLSIHWELKGIEQI